MKASQPKLAWALIAAAIAAAFVLTDPARTQGVPAPATHLVLEGSAVHRDWRSDSPGTRRHIKASDLPPPFASRSMANGLAVVGKPPDAQLTVPPGFEVKLFASGLDQPRLLRVAPNGDIFVVESWAGRIRLLRPSDRGDEVGRNEVFASGLNLPFGIAFYPSGDDPRWVYVANTDSVIRFPYRSGNLSAGEKAEIIVPNLPGGGNHWTRDIAFSPDGTKMFISVGSASNAAETIGAFEAASPRRWIAALRQRIRETLIGAPLNDETERANVLVFNPEGKGRRIYASGIRNCVGMAVNPTTGDLWCSTNERDGLGDDLPPDYITRVREGGFYGWPWYYIGANEDPLHKGARPDLKDRVVVPDILIQAHSASLQMVFYTGGQFPSEYNGNVFAAQHGSWNRSKPTGYKIIRGLVKDGAPTGEYEDFVTGFIINDDQVWGRPVGVAQAKDGSLLFSEDGNGTIWRVTNLSRATVH
jgi:glucose/arabinose dehydrogenase